MNDDDLKDQINELIRDEIQDVINEYVDTRDSTKQGGLVLYPMMMRVSLK